ncbi:MULTISPECIES: c-type cytochrome biogenesis protein CcsB [unclassified Crossiella]|uniref:c-type cytochrome biogenesis protein CcsB n=1 Tax=unclassified Crossiella TaxID=2620835 RepID=UPI001FFFCC6F|nr:MULTISPECIES: c-type cytochrome biogenesis protein CcsB [unclassified Crossiella]MCK2236745.1 c-type cytochrome biogenesis protein CcsB [Crossiella sp. S99.2]MCK2250413.1 c-type cytochrome biogenesis protein CcsB [Crossiella sp. S99.1]
MAVNETLSTYSDWSYASGLAVYVLAMGAYAAEYAFGRKPERAEAGQLVGAGAPVVPEPPRPGVIVEPPRATVPERAGRIGVLLTGLGAVFHFASLLLRGFATGRMPLGNMYEYVSAVALVGVVAWLVLLRRHNIRRLGLFVLLPLVILLFLAWAVLYAKAAPLVPALRSYWIVIHVSVIVIGSGLLILPGVTSMLYLVRKAHDANPARFARVATKLPEADTLDRISYRVTVFAFPLLTFGIIAGAIWAESAWGRYWGWDPKETVAFVSWVVYAAYLHARATAGWRGKPAAWINIFGWATVVFNLFFINMVVAGLHSYAGV